IRDPSPFQNPLVIGVRGFGKAYPVAFVRCPICSKGTVIALWQHSCRACGHHYGQLSKRIWADDVSAFLQRPFIRVTRPGGTGHVMAAPLPVDKPNRTSVHLSEPARLLDDHGW